MRTHSFKLISVMALLAPAAMAKTAMTLDKVKSSGTIALAFREASSCSAPRTARNRP